MTRIMINQQYFNLTDAQIDSLNQILAAAQILTEKHVHGKWSYVPDTEARPLQIKAVQTVEWETL